MSQIANRRSANGGMDDCQESVAMAESGTSTELLVAVLTVGSADAGSSGSGMERGIIAMAILRNANRQSQFRQLGGMDFHW
ncbi:hypothetical protein PSR63_11840 [Bremerella sp. P1]|nr:hypothetical protein [Bremerella sp. P1]WDI44626.1 hypothetical protein PSR63_11840 [Bremerella sp. P1]